MNKLTNSQRGIAALIFMTFLGSLMGVWVRYLGAHFKLYQQVAIRSFSGFLLGFIFYSSKIRLKQLKGILLNDLLLIMLRATSAIIGIGLYSLSILTTKFANVSFVFSLPTTALLGIILLKEKVNLQKLILLFLGFIGVILISININEITEFSFGKGEIYAFIATFFYSLSYIIRKWISPNLNNYEITQSASFFCFLFAFIISQILRDGVSEFSSIPIPLIIIIFLAGLTFIFIGYFSCYGFERVEAVKANNILILDSVFGLIIGFMIYHEIPTSIELIGGIIIIISAYYMNKIPNK